jgi:hypothetical protein
MEGGLEKRTEGRVRKGCSVQLMQIGVRSKLASTRQGWKKRKPLTEFRNT